MNAWVAIPAEEVPTVLELITIRLNELRIQELSFEPTDTNLSEAVSLTKLEMVLQEKPPHFSEASY